MNLIGGFLGNDSTFGRMMTKCGTVIAANILFVICCIPLFTIGAAEVALYHTVFSMLNAEDAINPFKTYWHGFQKNFIRATIYWLSFAGIMVLGYIDLRVCMQSGGWIQYLSSGIIAIMFVVFVIVLYLFPLLSVHTGRLSEILKKSIYLAVNRPLRLIGVGLLHVIPAVLLYVDEVNRPTYAFIGTFFGFGLIAYITGKMLIAQFKTYPEFCSVNN